MHIADWITLGIWVFGTSALGFHFKKYISSQHDYLLAAKRLRWWQIGTAQASDAVDATDFVALTGGGYRIGLAQVGFAWWGIGIGSIFVSRYMAPLLHRAGLYTNAQYLELRFSLALRICAAVLQILYRTVAMALVVYAVAVMFKEITGLERWLGVWAAMALTLIYVFASGQLGAAMISVPQVVLMLCVSIVVFISALVQFGGFDGFREHAAVISDRMRLAGHSEPGVPGGVYLWGLILTVMTYPIINQGVAQRVLGGRTEVDGRKGTIASMIPWCVVTGASVLLGIMGVALMPGLVGNEADALFPRFMLQFLPPGFLGLGVAALTVASMSAGAGIATAIAGLITVDILGPLSRSPKKDNLLIARLCAAGFMVLGTFLAMLIPYFEGMIPFYVQFTGTFFLPLTVPYIGGALFKGASRGAGMASLVGGISLAIPLFFADLIAKQYPGEEWLPVWMSHPQWRPFWVF
jgi:Na+/proline symporter